MRKLAIIVSTDATGQEGADTVNQDLARPEFKDMTVVERQHFNVSDLSISAQM